MFSFRPTTPSVRFKKGKLGKVEWKIVNPKIYDIIDDMGFPSSWKVDSKPELMETYDLTEEECFHFVLELFFSIVEGDGHVEWHYGGKVFNVKVIYDGITITARDGYILVWLKKHLEVTGFEGLELKPGTTRDLNILKVPSTTKNDGDMPLGDHQPRFIEFTASLGRTAKIQLPQPLTCKLIFSAYFS